MKRIIQLFSLLSFVFSSPFASGQKNEHQLHFQLKSNGISIPLIKSNRYETTQIGEIKKVFESGTYYRLFEVEVITNDTSDLVPVSNHKWQSAALTLRVKEKYQVIISSSEGNLNQAPKKMILDISHFKNNAQVVIDFKKGEFELKKLESYSIIDTVPNFEVKKGDEVKINLKAHQTFRFSNGEKKAVYYKLSEDFPLYYVQEFDSIQQGKFAQGMRLIQGELSDINSECNTPLTSEEHQNKYGYWEYFAENAMVKLAYFSYNLREKYEWFPIGELKSELIINNANKIQKNVSYLENGQIKSELLQQNGGNQYRITYNFYLDNGKLIMRKVYHSSNGINKEKLIERTTFYDSGELRMHETLGKNYNIRKYDKDGKIQH
ncbi:hypothetical protein CW751_13320 [Brumimicrobium salinarum]|uniref:Uncharacterized protein n=1 Tax=Brumimicrobium salinarum TaxID=2058658 RepID=A0A2I0QZT2_9FLAO|nr:hypothetical protein [Brumimicrobium salinarum]PKR79805.1 hypothetical protein CW751_13320 [Brumimicrobium salinarum]